LVHRMAQLLCKCLWTMQLNSLVQFPHFIRLKLFNLMNLI
jgi:hypothetical protein